MQSPAPRTRRDPDAHAPFALLARAEVSSASVELRRYQFPSPSEMRELDAAPIFSVTLPRAEGMRGEIVFEGDQPLASPVGPGLLRPAGIAMRSRGDGGQMDVLRCAFDPALFAEVTGLVRWDRAQLELCARIMSGAIMDLAERLRRELIHADFARDAAIDALVRLLMVEIGRLFSRAPRRTRRSGGLAPWQVARIDEALHRALEHWPTTAELAMLCGISRSHLSRTFAATTGLSLAEHAERIRMTRAEELVTGTALPLGQVAAILGFATPSAFSAAFRRAVGQTPGALRRASGPG